ncbi:MAG: hypothetical protein QNJ47_25535 [Nostocaceae cyanobacterium]|nr:hypothetical protein [Nostocaceae cyanobacterium]
MNKTNWLSQLPSLKSWLMAIKLAIPAYVGANVVLAFEFWRYSLVGSLLAATGNDGLILFFVVSVITLLLSLLWFLILVGLYGLLLKLLWSNPPQWLRLPKLKSLIMRDFGILVVSVFPIVVIFAIHGLLVSNIKQTFADLRTLRLTYDFFLLRFWWLWIISAAYLYQWRLRKSSI